MMLAVSQSSPVTPVKRSALPPGSGCGSRCRSFLDPSTVVTGAGVPPADGTLKTPSPAAKKIVPSSPQLAPHRRPGGGPKPTPAPPPAGGTFLMASPAQNPSHAPSGEKNGPRAASVPAIGVA